MTYYMHPSVMLSVLETWNHRPSHSTDVLGILLGTKNDGIITLHEAHYITHTISREKTLDFQCDIGCVNTIASAARSVNPNYTVVGWFTTYTEIDRVHHLLHNHLAGDQDEAELCLLTVDVTLSKDSLSPTLYTHSNVTVGMPTGEISETDGQLTLFSKTPLHTIIPTQERIALASILRGNTHDNQSLDAPVAIKSNADQIREALFLDLAQTVKSAMQYVEKAIKDPSQADEEVGKKLAYILANIPSYDQETSNQLLNDTIEDLQLFTSLAQLTKQTVQTAQFLPENGQ